MAELAVSEMSIYDSLYAKPEMIAASAGGDFFQNTGQIMLFIENASGVSSRSVTIVSQTYCDEGYLLSKLVTIPASESVIIGFFNVNRWNDEDARVQLGYTDETDLTLLPIKINTLE